MAKSASVNIRVDPETKAAAERVLEQIGLPMSNAIDMFLRQIVIQHRLPIDTKVPRRNPVSIDEMTDAELEAKLMRGYQQARNGEGRPFSEFAEELRQRYSI